MQESKLMAQNGSDPRGAWRGRNVFITGLSGFVGGWLALALVEAGAEVVAIVRDTGRQSSLELLKLNQRVNLVRGSIADYAVVERALNEYEVDSVFHLGAQTIVGAANRSPLSTFESNIKGTWNVLEAARVSKLVQRVVVASSDKAYGEQKTLPYTEESELNGLYPYDASKVCTDVLSRTYAATYGLPVAVTRCANIYGGMDLNWSRLVPSTVRSILRSENPIIRSDGTLERDYLFVDDVVRAYLILGNCVGETSVRGRAFNFGTATPVAVRTMVEKMLDLAGRDDLAPDVRGVGKTHGEIDRQFLDSRLAAEVLGWKPETDLETGLQKSMEWYAEHRVELGIV